MIFRKATFVSLSLCLAATGVLIWKLGLISEKDKIVYQELASKSDLKKEEEAFLEPYSAQQECIHVVKEFTTDKDGERLGIKIISERSYLTYEEKGGRMELVEKMEGVLCLMQEELYYLLPNGSKAYRQENGKLLVVSEDPKLSKSWIEDSRPGLRPMQVVRRIEADNAIYSYATDHVEADKVKLSRLVMPGCSLSGSMPAEKTLLSSEAKKASFSLAGDGFKFKAEQVKAVLY